jgi:hypothetical protein
VAKVSRTVPAGADDVFAILADGWSYASWVVGASHIRDVDADWPAVGSHIYHSSGPWPVQVEDVTTVLAVESGREIRLEARLWVLGNADIRLTLDPAGPGRTVVTMEERASGGPALLVPSPVQAALLGPRNIESIDRLGALARGRGHAARRAPELSRRRAGEPPG